jgi:hypothetical protein
MTYFDPPKEYGIAVNFGTNDFGSGNIQPKEALKPAKQEIVEEEQVEEQPEEVMEEQVEESTPVQNDAAEDVITQNNEDAIAIKKKEEANKKKEAEQIAEEKNRIEKERIAEVERKKQEEKKKAEKERKAKREGVKKILEGYSNNDGNADGGEGDDNKAGDKGKTTGDPNATDYYVIGGGGGGGNYRLGNRRALSKPKPTYDCNEEGRVFVRISVDKNGKVIAAQAGVKGTTNSASCLLSGAKEAALRTKFNPDSKAPAKQTGIIIYNFSYGDKKKKEEEK